MSLPFVSTVRCDTVDLHFVTALLSWHGTGATVSNVSNRGWTTRGPAAPSNALTRTPSSRRERFRGCVSDIQWPHGGLWLHR